MRYVFYSLALVPTLMAAGTPMVCFTEPPAPAPIVQGPNLEEEKCLATMVYGEARGEPEKGMVAVAYTAVNRAAKRTVCHVVLAPKQYSIFTNNPQLRAAAMSLDIDPTQKNVVESAAWRQSVKVAQAVMRKEVKDPTHGATHYLAPVVMEEKDYEYPQWSLEYRLMAIINNHRFYKKS